MSSEYEPDLKLKAELDRLLTYPAPSGMWSDVETRARKKGWTPEEQWPSTAEGGERIGVRKQRPVQKASASKRSTGLRVAVFASIAVVLIAAVAFGSFMAVRNLAQPHFVLAITDDNVIVASGQTMTATPSGQWQRLPLSSEGGYIKALVIDPSNPSVLYAGTDEGLFKSTDGARSWKQLSKIQGMVFFVLVDPAAPASVYALAAQPESGVGPARLLRSDDGGATWTDLSATMPPHIMVWPPIMWADPTSSPSTIYTLTATGIDEADAWRSTDRGKTWTKLSPEEAAQAKSKPFYLWFDSSFEGPISDSDTGSLLGVLIGRIDPGDSSIRYAGTGEGVYKSTDGGKTWKKASAGLTSSVVWRVVADPSSASILYAATSAGIFKSGDAGAHWSKILAGQGSVVLAPSSPSTLYAWTSAGLFRTTDGGKNWTPLAGTGLVLTVSAPGNGSLGGPGLLLVSPDNPDTVFAKSGDDPALLFRSTDGGKTWSQILLGMAPADGWGSVVADPNNPSTLFASRLSGQEDGSWLSGQVCKSTDAGATWTVVSPREWVDAVVEIAVDSHVPSNVYVVRATDPDLYTVSRSLDGGTTWENVRLEGLGKYLGRLLFDPRSPDTLYVLTHQEVEDVPSPVVYRSTDGGAAWENITGELANTQSLDIALDPAPGGTLYAVTERGLFKWVPKK
jgi:photosystem II stability/assembly factor-like uncharacterized protein